MTERTIPLTQGFEAVVSEEDYGYLSKFKWTYSAGYAVRRRPGVDTQQILMHRLIMGVDASPGFEVDHVDMDKLNNRRENLRFVTRSQNITNKNSAGNISGFKGVRPVKGSPHLFCMQIQHPEGRVRISGFPTAEDAARAYDGLALHFFGDFARINFADSVKMTPEEVAQRWPARRQSSQFRGVSFNKATKKWKATARISMSGEKKYKFLGYFATEEAAAKAHDAYLDAIGDTAIPRNF